MSKEIIRPASQNFRNDVFKTIQSKSHHSVESLENCDICDIEAAQSLYFLICFAERFCKKSNWETCQVINKKNKKILSIMTKTI